MYVAFEAPRCLINMRVKFSDIVPDIKAGKRVIIAAHGNSLRALVQHLDNIPSDVITGLNIPTGKGCTVKYEVWWLGCYINTSSSSTSRRTASV